MKKVKRVSFKAYSIIWAELFILTALLIGLLIYQPLTKNNQSSLPSLKPLKVSAKTSPVKTSTPSAQPKPISTPSAQIPPSLGNSARVPILMYHYIGNNPNPADIARNTLSVTPDKFDEQLGYLSKNGYTPISLDTLYAALKGGQLPPKPIVLTFDDGYIDFYVNAFPILQRYGFHATSFIPTGLINQGYYMTWDQIKELQKSGLISFEAHSVNHVDLAVSNPAQLKFQVEESKKDLEAQTGVPVNFFAYPYGTSNSLAWQEVKNAGFFGAVGTWYGTVESEGTIFDMPRVRVSGTESLPEFISRL